MCDRPSVPGLQPLRTHLSAEHPANSRTRIHFHLDVEKETIERRRVFWSEPEPRHLPTSRAPPRESSVPGCQHSFSLTGTRLVRWNQAANPCTICLSFTLVRAPRARSPRIASSRTKRKIDRSREANCARTCPRDRPQEERHEVCNSVSAVSLATRVVVIGYLRFTGGRETRRDTRFARFPTDRHRRYVAKDDDDDA